MYEVGEKVFYPVHGVGVIQAIEEKNILNRKRKYYTVRLLQNNMTIMIPVEMSEKLGLRGMTDRDEIALGLKILEKEAVDIEQNWKIRYVFHQNKVKSGSFVEVAKVVRNLFVCNQKKELSNSEKQLFENALKLTVDEVSISLKIGRLEAEHLITESLEKCLIRK